uniref:protein-ribulosamine 3-kinase n=1 Tax=Bionectria ochroleuca TaxID=29856 RepID=A0A0B7JUM7_BIOOC
MDIDTLTLDPAIVAALPVQDQVVAISKHGDTRWSTGYKISIEDEEDDHEFFIKILDREEAKELAEGEFESMTLMHQLIPEAIVPPIAWGMFKTDNSKAFYLTYFRDLDKEHPPNDILIRLISKIHHKESPTGKFGFHVPTFYGCRKVDNTWCETWEEFFSRELRSSISFAQAVLQHNEELEGLAKTLFDLVVPRLLRPLETGGRSIKPQLVFGDLWDENVQVDHRTRAAALFDPCCFYGHFEFDFQCMTSDRYSLNHNFVNVYKEQMGVSEPAEEFDDRVALYALVKSEMKRLIKKYPDGLQGLEAKTTL